MAPSLTSKNRASTGQPSWLRACRKMKSLSSTTAGEMQVPVWRARSVSHWSACYTPVADTPGSPFSILDLHSTMPQTLTRTIDAFDRRSNNATKARRAVVLTMLRPLFMPSKNRRRSP